MITQDDIIYFLITDRFYDADPNNNAGVDKSDPHARHGGDLKGVLAKLDYILDLGATTVWISPVYSNFPGIGSQQPYHYYWPKDFEKIDEHLFTRVAGYPDGDRRYLKDFVDACHARGLKVILDVVVNHTGYDQGQPVFPATWYRNLPPDPDFSGLPKLDLANSNVVDYFVNNLIAWVGSSGIDGLRMDMAKDIGGYSSDPNIPVKDEDFNKFWYYYKSMVKGRFPDLFIVGEVLDAAFSDVRMIASFQNQSDLSSIFDFPVREVIKDVVIYDAGFLTVARPRLNDNETAGVLDLDDPSNGGYYTNSNRLITLLDNHDLDRRIMSEIRTRYPGDSNKAFAYSLADFLYTFLFVVRGIPQIYYGSEVGLEGWKTGGDDADLRRDFPWSLLGPDNQVTAANPLEKGLQQRIQALIALRKGSQALKYGVTITLWVDQFVYACLRYYGDEVVVAVFNNGHAPMPYPLQIPMAPAANPDKQTIPDRILTQLTNIGLANVADSTDKYKIVNGTLSVQVPGKSYKILAGSAAG